MTNDPKIYLAIDNCFCSRRWTRPQDWTRLIRDMGVTYIEASADTECDPLYMGADYQRRWAEEVNKQCAITGAKIANVYSGHGTYSTLGLSHTDEQVRLRFRDEWMKPQADIASAVSAGFGFAAHAIPEYALNDAAEYRRFYTTLIEDLGELAKHAAAQNMRYISLEQMYTPHMPPWTIAGAEEMVRAIWKEAGAAMYLTIDIGHMNGQRYFIKPDGAEIASRIRLAKESKAVKRAWTGPKRAHDIYLSACRGEIAPEEAITKIAACWEGYDHMFASPEDGSITGWLKALGAWSPIVHLQQSDGLSSPHWPFTKERNKQGVAKGEDILFALAESFDTPAPAGMPPKVESVMLTLEPFFPTACDVHDSLAEVEESVRYWRAFIPEDGMRLSDAIAYIEARRSEPWKR